MMLGQRSLLVRLGRHLDSRPLLPSARNLTIRYTSAEARIERIRDEALLAGAYSDFHSSILQCATKNRTPGQNRGLQTADAHARTVSQEVLFAGSAPSAAERRE